MEETNHSTRIHERLADIFRNIRIEAVTRLSLTEIAGVTWRIFESDDPTLKAMGVNVGSGRCSIALRNSDRPLGVINLFTTGDNGLVVFDNHDWAGTINTNIRIIGDDCFVFVGNLRNRTLNLQTMFMRSHRQRLFVGYDCSAVGLHLEMEGEGNTVAIGDDLLGSSGVWIRNSDMHAIYDVNAGKVVNAPCDTIIERHVWLGQDALILNCKRIGGGSIIGTKSIIKNDVPRLSVVGGSPQKVLRSDTSWGRAVSSIEPDEKKTIELLRSLTGA